MTKIAIQGELGSFSHQAAKEMVPGCTVVPCAYSAEVFDKVVRGKVDGAVIPIENTLAGSVVEHYDLLFANKVFIQREFQLRIVHNLIASPNVKKGDIRRVYSHPIALAQCRKFLHTHSKMQAMPFYDTAGSVKHVMSEKLKDAAGIASELAAKQYGAKILQKGIEDNKSNFTRFFLIHRKERILPNANKTSLAFTVHNVPGILFKVLSVFALRDISLTRIESRPVHGKPWEYTFFVDIMRGNDQVMKNALQHLHEVAEEVKVLGIYPAAK